MGNDFWLYHWMDEQGVKKERDIARIIADDRTFEDLGSIAAGMSYAIEPIKDEDNYVVAGTGIDLSGELGCYAWECIKRQIDDVFSRSWHYFDKIVVRGLTPLRYTQMMESNDRRFAKLVLQSQLRLLLYIRHIGAEDLLIFRQKPPACRVHYVDHLNECGLEHLASEMPDIANNLATEAQVAIQQVCGDHWHYAFDHPLLEHTHWGIVPAETFRIQPGKGGPRESRMAAQQVLADFASHLVADVQESKALHAPLAIASGLHAHSLKSDSPTATSMDEVALELEIPVLQGLPLKDLIKLRESEHASFERFRRSLKTAMRERLNESESASSADIAADILDDIITPAVGDLADRLRKANRLLNKKSASSGGLGVALMTIGLTAGVPLLLPFGVVSLCSPVLHYHKFLEERRDIELSDMYFLWNLQNKQWRNR
ncbi:hypothetical protein BKA00_003166 [Actinomadura coerulea]|uniref:Uncharacterized protein n=1 Tax=Actinomadura coerulea TaxID=46159 RepID=A0A7X0FYU0_9ACTN|nr:hypothetical protein [Actinomadura coerulea]MBB6396252.1 hypothetical protein [Actinomadura coerulea]GGQ39109.1 hypothetical protein GCM10010187_66370 [Actinomadura coerulea]